MRKSILALSFITFLSGQAMAQAVESDDLEFLDLETPGCGNGGSNYLGEVTSYDPVDVVPDLTMEPATSINTASNASKPRASQNTKADLHCIDSFEREANDPK